VVVSRTLSVTVNTCNLFLVTHLHSIQINREHCWGTVVWMDLRVVVFESGKKTVSNRRILTNRIRWKNSWNRFIPIEPLIILTIKLSSLEKLKKISLTGSGKQQPQQKNNKTGKKVVEDEDDEDLNERVKIGILNAFEKSKRSDDQRQKNSQLTSKVRIKQQQIQ
jgi:hypothetical protein